MSNPVVYTWPAADTTAIAALQTLGIAGTVTLDGSLSLQSIANNPNGVAYADFKDITRTISITSTNNLSAVSFTITGTLNSDSIPQSEVLLGPNNNTVFSVGTYDKIISITTNAGAPAFSVGSGTTGFTRFFLSNFQCAYPALSIQVDLTGTINYSFCTTLQDASDASPAIAFPIVAMTNATTNQLGSYNNATRYSALRINSSTTGSLNVTFLQQGII